MPAPVTSARYDASSLPQDTMSRFIETAIKDELRSLGEPVAADSMSVSYVHPQFANALATIFHKIKHDKFSFQHLVFKFCGTNFSPVNDEGNAERSFSRPRRAIRLIESAADEGASLSRPRRAIRAYRKYTIGPQTFMHRLS